MDRIVGGRFDNGNLCKDCPLDGEYGARCYQCPRRRETAMPKATVPSPPETD